MRKAVVPVLVGLLVVATGCTGGGADPAQQRAESVTSAPDTALTLVADADPVASAVSASRALFDRSTVAVVARDGDDAAALLGSSAAVGLGVPLLVEPTGGGAGDVVGAELDRLGATVVLVVGDTGAAMTSSPEGAREVVPVAADAAAVEAATGLDLADADPVPADGGPVAVSALDPQNPAALRPVDVGGSGSSTAEDSPADGDATVPQVDRGDPLTGTVVLASGSPESLAGIATARAAGADVRLTGGQTDPRGSADVVTALSQNRPDTVVALGADFAGVQGLDWKLRTAVEGPQLPGGGQLLFPQHMMVALYGTPGTGALGVLGEQGLPESIQRARDTAAPYQELVDATVVPAFEIIATVASSAAGADGDYSAESDVETLRPWVEAAGEAGVFVVLDLQPGRTDFLTQARLYQPLLELPHVGLALDPEWRLRPDQVHLTQIGQVGIEEVNQVVTWLADLTRDRALPQKLLVLHQFQVRMIVDRERLDTSRDELAIMVHVDGQGTQPMKQDTWRVLHQDAPAPLSWGWKNFYDEDSPTLTPDQTIAGVQPTPQLITYQ
ncbi:hypothetical protein [Geodermatophilus maliterrae]|uniref:Lipoprotein n=1 Tax=Geodermatophilus maliterrae TaxID=3162531 RepID=A0ABV3XD91_9ACTN